MDKKPMRQTTVRVDPELLRKARYHLDREGLSVTQFLVNQLERYVQEHEHSAAKPKRSAAPAP